MLNNCYILRSKRLYFNNANITWLTVQHVDESAVSKSFRTLTNTKAKAPREKFKRTFCLLLLLLLIIPKSFIGGL